jgi:sugar phosphate isomerase/epimerase
MNLGPFEQLVLCTMTSPDAEFEDRVVAAAAAGYSGIGLRPKHRDRALSQGLSDEAMRAILADNAVALVELEVLSGWGSEEDKLPAVRAHEDAIYELADSLGGRHMTVTGAGLVGPIERTVEKFAGVCDRAADHGLIVALEFLPWTEVPDADHARQIVQLAGRSNSGVQVDTWHHFRGAASDDQLRALPPELVAAIQFDDGMLSGEGTLYEQTFERLNVGEGEFALVHFLQLLAEHGVTAPLCVEIISTKFKELPVADAARLSADATRKVLDEAFGSRA